MPEGAIFTVQLGSKNYYCARVSGRLQAGKIDQSDPAYFIPKSAEIARIKIAYRKAFGVRRSQAKRKLARLRAAKRAGDQACAEGASRPPMPTPAGSAYFDSDGNLTIAGKALFIVPLSLTANISAGAEVFEARRCTTCHLEQGSGFTMPALRSGLLSAAGITLTDQQAANLIAFLNRGLQ